MYLQPVQQSNMKPQKAISNDIHYAIIMIVLHHNRDCIIIVVENELF